MKLLAGTDRGNVLGLLANLVIQPANLFFKCFEPLTGCDDVVQPGATPCE